VTDSKKKNKEKMFSATNIICYLRTGKRFKIDNIYVKSGTSYENGVAHSFPGKVEYRCIDEKEFKKSSLESNPTSYRLVIPRQKFVDPKYIILLALSTLTKKLNTIEAHVNNSNTESFYSMNTVEITRLSQKTIYALHLETYTIGNMLFKYGLMVDPTIKNIHCTKLHPSHTFINLEIEHPDPKSIILSAIGLIKKEIKNVETAF
jgi:DNA-directed RNA polymerase subunit L